jgi:hypothetical protein
MSRKVPTVLTIKDIETICFQANPATLAQSGAISALRPPFSSKLRGTALRCSFDGGSVLEVRFLASGKGLVWRKEDGEWHEEACECLESSAENVFLVHYLRTDTMPYEAVTLVLDRNTSLVTRVEDRLGTVNSNRDVKRTLAHGYIGDADPPRRHAKTDELVGVILDWRFADDVVLHAMYETVQCCAFVSPPPAAAPDWYGFFLSFNPTRYRKIAENLYLISFTAPGSSGMEANMLMDLNKMRAVGSVFGIDWTDTLLSYTFGARGAYAAIGFIGRYNV